MHRARVSRDTTSLANRITTTMKQDARNDAIKKIFLTPGSPGVFSAKNTTIIDYLAKKDFKANWLVKYCISRASFFLHCTDTDDLSFDKLIEFSRFFFVFQRDVNSRDLVNKPGR